MGSDRPSARALLICVSVALGYLLLAEFGTLTCLSGRIALFWPATGLAVAAVVLYGAPALLGVALGALTHGLLTSSPAAAAALALGALGSAALGAQIYRRGGAALHGLARQREVFLHLLAAFFAPLPAVAGAVVAMGVTYPPVPDRLLQLATWWIGDGLGILAAAPALLALPAALARWRDRSPGRVTPVALLALLLVVTLGWALYGAGGREKIFLLFMLLLAAHALLGGTGVKVTGLLVAAATVLAVAQGLGGFTGGGREETVIVLVIFVAFFVISALLLAGYPRPQALAWPGAVLLLGWIMSSWVFTALERQQLAFEEYRLRRVVEDTQQDLTRRMQTYCDALRGGAGLVAVNGFVVNVEEWRRYTESLRLFDLYPGVHGVGIIQPLRPGELDAFCARIRRDQPDFRVHAVPGVRHPPPTDEAGYAHHVIFLVEPRALNAAALGLDVASEANRQEAARHARDTGAPHATRTIQLVQDRVSRPGFLLYLPVYRPGTPTTTVAERRAAFLGWIYAPFVMEEFLRGVLGARAQEVDFSLFEGGGTAPASRIYGPGEPPGGFDRVTHLELAQQDYTIGWVRGAASPAGPHAAVYLTAGSLILASTLLAGLLLSLQGFARRAGELASARTRELREANRQLAENNASLVTTQQQLRLQEAESRKLALIAARTINAVVLTSADGRIEWVNDGFTRMTGYKLAEVSGRKPGSILQGLDTDPADVRRFHELLAQQMGFIIEILNYRKDGRPIWLRIEVQPITDDTGKLTNFMGIQTDITEQRRAQADLEEARRRAEAANRAKSNFLANASHELRTPLNVILGQQQLLLEGRYGSLPPEPAAVLRTAHENSRHLLALINDLLDLTKAESGKLQLSPGPVDPRRLVDECIALMSEAATQKELRVTARFGHATPLIEADAARLRQILLNLLGNACKFTPAGGAITVETRESDAPAEFFIEVADTGIGLKPSDQERIFQDFEQVEAGHGGTGLGLPIARRLAGLHGGSLTVKSEPNRGSRFILRLPRRVPAPVEKIADATPVSVPESAAKPVRPSDYLILVVEDYPANLELLVSYLEMEGYRVAQATSGEEAIEQATLLLPNLVLMDVKMPGMDGLEATRRLKAAPRTRHLPVVALTAFSDEEHARRCREAGAVGFLVKPIDPEALDAVIARQAIRPAGSLDSTPPMTTTTSA